MNFSPLMLIHMATAVAAILIGGLTLALKKGTLLHRLTGRLWILLMVVTALVSFGIRTHGHFSAVHILSVITLLVIARSIHAAMRGRIRAHQRGMLAMYAGLLIAGGLTLLPGRRLGDLLWQSAGLI